MQAAHVDGGGDGAAGVAAASHVAAGGSAGRGVRTAPPLLSMANEETEGETEGEETEESDFRSAWSGSEGG